MGTYCNHCNRKVTCADNPISCDCNCGDGYCFMCIDENENGIKVYTPLKDVYDKNGKKIENCFQLSIEPWECDTCGNKLEFSFP